VSLCPISGAVVQEAKLFSTRTQSHWQEFAESSLMKELDKELGSVVNRQEQHRSQAFNGHIDQEPPIDRM
jgi:hypothetical protein